jgi:hypothetical protein
MSNTPGSLGRRFVARARNEGVGSALARAGAYLWSTRAAWFVLRCDLGASGEPPSDGLDFEMEEVDPAAFIGFKEAMKTASGKDLRDLEDRQKMCDAGIEKLYVGFTAAGDPIFAQWLITPDRQDGLHRLFSRDLFPSIGADEVLTEGAYTFAGHRRRGAMKRGKAQVLAVARSTGFQRAYTTVDMDNIPSLRGNARVGFDLAYVGVVVRRFGTFRRGHAPVRPEDLAVWKAAIKAG